MALKVDPFVQRRLLDLARLDRTIGAAEHRRRTLPELALIAAGADRLADLRGDLVLRQTEVGDLDAATRKLDTEVEQVRARAARDAQRLADGLVPPKELTNLQHEIVSLNRRQAALEDEELELMEQREAAAATMAEAEGTLAALAAELEAAQRRRDDAFADIDDELARCGAERADVVAGLPEDLLALYQRIHAGGRVAAAQLAGSRCEACRMDLDRVALSEIHGAGVEAIVRCPECSAILIRS